MKRCLDILLGGLVGLFSCGCAVLLRPLLFRVHLPEFILDMSWAPLSAAGILFVRRIRKEYE